MAEPTPATRAVTYERDGERCCSCGTLSGLQYQHRAVEGMGGRVARPFLEEGVTSCGDCNPRYEGDLQAWALVLGWKTPTWVRDQGLSGSVPVFYTWEGRWCELSRTGMRTPITKATAHRMMREVYGDARWEQMERAAA